ncbi:30S ribosomal protein S4e [Candidatus Woesearchaeota archaeon]|nr:30S ribosomal protein S4e [Candidatus Woesearchaeota archaeon]
MKNHLKRIASPKTWFVDRKVNTFIVRPNPGAHSLDNGLPLGVLLRDDLELASTMGEIKKMLNNKEVLVDGIRRKDHSFMVGLFDVLSLPELKKYYRMVLDKKGRLTLKEVSAQESTLKLAKVVGKTMMKGSKVQFNLHDGRNILSDGKANVGDTFVLTLPKASVKKILPLKNGAKIFLTKGKHAGDLGVLKAVKGNEATYSAAGADVETAKAYLFVVGEKDTEIKLD